MQPTTSPQPRARLAISTLLTDDLLLHGGKRVLDRLLVLGRIGELESEVLREHVAFAHRAGTSSAWPERRIVSRARRPDRTASANFAGVSARNPSASARSLSTFTPTISRPAAPYFSCIAFSQGNERRHGTHQDAQKSTQTTRPSTGPRPSRPGAAAALPRSAKVRLSPLISLRKPTRHIPDMTGTSAAHLVRLDGAFGKISRGRGTDAHPPCRRESRVLTQNRIQIRETDFLTGRRPTRTQTGRTPMSIFEAPATAGRTPSRLATFLGPRLGLTRPFVSGSRLSAALRGRAANTNRTRWPDVLAAPLLIVAVSLFIVAADNDAFWSAPWRATQDDGHRVAILATLFALVFVTLTTVLSLAFGQTLLRGVAVLLLLVAANCGFFMTQYGVVIDESMIRNAVETTVLEAAPLLSAAYFSHIVFYGVLPAIIVLFVPLGHLRWQTSVAVRLCTAAIGVGLLA